MPHLPIEIVELIIQNINPPDGTVAVRASDIVTRTLYSTLTLCKATYAASLEGLYRNCLYIDSQWRLDALLRSYDSQMGIFARQVDPQRFKLSASKSMYLAPFSSDTINEPEVLAGVLFLFEHLKNDLRRLVIDMPLRSAYPDERPGEIIRPALRDAFLKLTSLEEFVSIRDELYLSTTVPSSYKNEPPVWSLWPRLRRLALYNLDIDLSNADLESDAPRFLNQLPNLEVVALTRADGMDEQDVSIMDLSGSLSPSTRIVLIEAWRDRLRPLAWVEDGAMDLSRFETGLRGRFLPRKKILGMQLSAAVEAVLLVRPRDTSIDQNDDISFCQAWVRSNALNGSLWD